MAWENDRHGRPFMSTALLPPPARPALTPFGVRTPQSFRWTLATFYDLGNQGVFDDRRVMLIDGEILEMPLPNPPHAPAGALPEEALRAIFGAGFVVRTEKPLPLSQSTD